MKVIVSVCASVGCGEDTGKRLSRERILFCERSKTIMTIIIFVKMGRAICLGASQLRVDAVLLAPYAFESKGVTRPNGLSRILSSRPSSLR